MTELKRPSISATLRVALALLSLTLLAALFTPAAQADTTICAPGSGAGQCNAPSGLATDFETGRLYVADQGNNRVDAFEADGTFVMAFGWGVDTGAAKFEICTSPSTCQAGRAGSGAGQFAHPEWVAVDNDEGSASRHDLYVGTDNFHVQKFEPNGTFVKAFGTKGTGECQINSESDPIAVGPDGDIYVAEEGSSSSRVERFDLEGNCLGEVSIVTGASLAVKALGVDSEGNLYMTGGPKVRKYNPAGALLYERGVSDFEATAKNKGGLATEARGIAVDGEDNVFTRQRGQKLHQNTLTNFFTEYDSTGEIVRRFGYVSGQHRVPALAAYSGPAGDLFTDLGSSLEATEVKYLSFSSGPVIFPESCQVKENGNTKATFAAEVNPEGKETKIYFEYITEADFVANGNGFNGSHPASKTPEGQLAPSLEQVELEEQVEKIEKEIEGASGEAKEKAEAKLEEEQESLAQLKEASTFDLHEATATAAVEPETKYRCRAVAINPDGSSTGEEGSFTSLRPIEIGATTVTEVGAEEATLNVQVDPLEISTTGFFEYVEEAAYLRDIEELGPEHGFDHALKVPDPATEEVLDFGGGNGFITSSQVIGGLKPATSYRFRLHATNLFFELKGETGVLGPVARFRTYGSAEALPDDRAWELVSPGEKNSADVVGTQNTRGLIISAPTQVIAGATDGESVTYTSWTSFGEEAEGAPASSQYLSHRTPAGWQTKNISAGGIHNEVVVPPFLGYSPDLKFGGFQAGRQSLAPGCPSGHENLYLREADGTARCLTPEAPGDSREFGNCFAYAGASEDGSRVFFRAQVSYAGVPAGSGFSLYEWHEGQIHVVSVLPEQSEPATPGPLTSFGAKGAEECHTTDLSIVRSAISADGTRAVWTHSTKSGATRLLMRVNGAETVPLDAKQPSGTGGGGGLFWGASKDGSVVYFTDPNKLLPSSKAEQGAEDLYRYELGAEEPLTDVTHGPVPGDVQGVLGASEDGSKVYYAAKAPLTPPSEENEAGEHAELNKENLYLYDIKDGKNHFIAQLSTRDGRNWEEEPVFRTARVTPDGNHLAFLSTQTKSLVGYDNTLTATGGQFANNEECEVFLFAEASTEGGPNCPEAFVYSAEADKLTCVSCNPSGSRPLGPTLFSHWANSLEGPRVISDNGERLFFESFDRLSPSDESIKRDVYEFEFAGSGSCSEKSTAYDPTSDGCHYLLSSGQSDSESYLVDASADGRDVFLSTRQGLNGWDTNGHYDVYDAREGGGFPEPSQAESCLGEACKPAASTPPATTSPTTPNFHGQGNPVSEKTKAKKHKHKKKRHKAKAKKKGHGKAKREGRATR
jgi:hypothetical protein